MDIRRRNMLQAGLAAGSLFLPVPWALVRAQSDGASKLVRAPKFALVVGNAAYKNAAVLKNPANDARAMADALKGAGFEVTMKLDATRTELAAAIRAHAQALAAKPMLPGPSDNTMARTFKALYSIDQCFVKIPKLRPKKYVRRKPWRKSLPWSHGASIPCALQRTGRRSMCLPIARTSSGSRCSCATASVAAKPTC